MLSPEWLREYLACPRDHGALRFHTSEILCEHGHHFPCVDGIPILLVEGAPATHRAIRHTLEFASGEKPPPPTRSEPCPDNSSVDSFVQREIVGTNGLLYR